MLVTPTPPKTLEPIIHTYMPLQRVPINNFRGGLNTRDGPFDLQPNESPDLSNVTLTALVGSLQVRAGKTALQAATPGVIDNCKQIALGSTPIRRLMCSIGGKIYSCDTGGTFTLLFTGTAGTVWAFEQYVDATGADKVWCMNGTDAPQKWDGAAGATSAWAGVVPAGNQLKVWRNKMVILGVAATPHRLFLSKFGDPEATTGAYDFIDVRGAEDELDSLIDLNVLGDRLYVFKQRSLWVITDPVSFANRRIGAPGCFSRFQSDVCEEKLYWFNEQGIWSTGGVAIEFESGTISNYFPQNLTLTALAKARLIGTRDAYPRVLLSIPIGGSVTNNVLVELIPHINFRRIGGRRYLLLPAFMLHTFSASSLANFKTNNAWGVYGGDGTLSKLYQYFNGTTDDGVAITARWQSAWLAIQAEEPLERVRRLNVDLSGDAIVDVFKDFGTVPDFSATLPDPATAGDILWDGGIWDGGTWDAPSTYRFARVRPESRGRYHSIRFRTLPGGLPFSINTAELAIRGGKEH